MLQTLKNAWKTKDIRSKIIFTLFILVLYRIGTVIPVPFVEANNFNEETVRCSGGEGTIKVEKTLLGDCNGDGTVSGKDLTRILRYLADYDNSTGTSSVDIDHAAADLNGDSVIDGKDITRLLKILAD